MWKDVQHRYLSEKHKPKRQWNTTSRSFILFGNYEWNCCKCARVGVCVNIRLHLSRVKIPGIEIPGWYGTYTFNFWRKLSDCFPKCLVHSVFILNCGLVGLVLLLQYEKFWRLLQHGECTYHRWTTVHLEMVKTVHFV